MTPKAELPRSLPRKPWNGADEDAEPPYGLKKSCGKSMNAGVFQICFGSFSRAYLSTRPSYKAGSEHDHGHRPVRDGLSNDPRYRFMRDHGGEKN